MVAIALAIPFTPFGRYLGFVPPPSVFFLFLAAITVIYLILVEFVKRLFFRHVALE